MTPSRENLDARRALRSGGSCQRIKNTTTKQKWPGPRGDYNGGNSRRELLETHIFWVPAIKFLGLSFVVTTISCQQKTLLSKNWEAQDWACPLCAK